MQFTLFFFTLTLSVTTFAAEKKVCQISEVLNTSYESIYNFSFNDHPKLTSEKDQTGNIKLNIGALNYSKADDDRVDIATYNNPNKYFIFYDGYLSETVEFTKNLSGKNEAQLKAILDETDELYYIAKFSCKVSD